LPPAAPPLPPAAPPLPPSLPSIARSFASRPPLPKPQEFQGPLPTYMRYPAPRSTVPALPTPNIEIVEEPNNNIGKARELGMSPEEYKRQKAAWAKLPRSLRRGGGTRRQRNRSKRAKRRHLG
jgi:hypothetical protein